jgi:hypothetical protein
LTKELEQKVTLKINFNYSSHIQAQKPRPWSHPELVYADLFSKIYMPPNEFPTVFLYRVPQRMFTRYVNFDRDHYAYLTETFNTIMFVLQTNRH